MRNDSEQSLALHCLNEVVDSSLQARIFNSPVAWIGSGLSRVAAELGAAVSLSAQRVTCSMTPFDFCQIPGDSYLPVIVSYSGGNSDSISVAEHTAIHHRKAVLITAHPDCRCTQILKNKGVDVTILTFPEHAPERRFVALQLFLGSCAIAHRLASTQTEDALLGLALKTDYLPFLEVEKWTDYRWVILAGGLTRIAALGWQVLFGRIGLSGRACG